MIRSKSPLVQQTLAGITLILVLGALAVICPVISLYFSAFSGASNRAAPHS